MNMNKKPRRWHGTAVYKVKEVYSPIMESFRGYRILVAVPNLAARKPYTGEYTVSFRRPYLVMQSSDYGEHEIGRKTTLAIQWLLQRGFERVLECDEYVAKYSRPEN